MFMNLSTTYMGIPLKNPLMAAASPLSKDLDTMKKLQDKGISCVVTYSLFEEQITHDQKEMDHFLTQGTDSFAEAMNYFPEPDAFHNINAEEYLEHLRILKENLDIPVIGSLNGVSAGGWMDYAKQIEEAGADALELNIYYIPTDPRISAQQVEAMYLTDLATVKQAINIPVAMKLSPYFSAFANLAKKLDDNGADALVLFNRFYQPDIDIENLEVVPNLQFSSPYELRLPLRWIAILYNNVNASLAATSGIHSAADVAKAVMAGADVTMLASVLLEKGVDSADNIISELTQWMADHEYDSIEQMKGSMSYKNVAEPAAFERANYMKTLQSFDPFR
jgi:dihydroorotate dehydrogenase (fumarate)